MAFCGKCGAKLDGEKFCPNCGAPVSSMQNMSGANIALKPLKKTGVWKKAAIAIVAVVIVFFIISRFTSTVDEPCDWCGNSPSVAYELSDGSYSYVCKECSKSCVLCGNKATTHYENLAGMMVFVCNDCYEELQQYSN